MATTRSRKTGTTEKKPRVKKVYAPSLPVLRRLIELAEEFIRVSKTANPRELQGVDQYGFRTGETSLCRPPHEIAQDHLDALKKRLAAMEAEAMKKRGDEYRAAVRALVANPADEATKARLAALHEDLFGEPLLNPLAEGGV